jgi:alpha-N-acetylglucosamine transferase
MSDLLPFKDILQRVEQMLNTLEASPQFSADFRASCDQLDSYLINSKISLAASGTLTDQQKNRVAAIIKRLAGLQKRAETRANIPTGLQKHIAEQSD